MTYLAHSVSACCSSLTSAFPEELNATLFIFRSIHPCQKSFSELSHLFWFPPKVYSVYALFTKVTKARSFPPLLILNKQFYQLLRPPGCSLFHCHCAVKGKHGVIEADYFLPSVQIHWKGTFWMLQWILLIIFKTHFAGFPLHAREDWQFS